MWKNLRRVAPAIVTILLATSTVAVADAVRRDTGSEPAAVDRTAAIEEVIVTAQKREERLQDVPISIAALDARVIESKGIKTLLTVGDLVPNVLIAPHSNSPNSVVVFIRGIGTNGTHTTLDPAVAIYIDGIYQARATGLGAELAELERVEVLRGPQGTLYGRNATAGAVNFITQAPVLGELHFKQSFTVGNLSEFRSVSSLNVPLGDELAVELDYLNVRKDGFIRNLGTGSEYFGNQDRQGARFAARWVPNEAFELRYSYDSSWLDDTSSFLATVAPYPAESPRPSHGSPLVRNMKPNDTRSQGHTLTLSYELGEGLTLKSLTGYREVDAFEYQDYLTGVFSPVPVFTISDHNTQKQFSEELQLLGKALDGRLDYIAGLYYFRESGGADYVAGMPTSNTLRLTDFRNVAYAVFTQGTWTPRVLDERLHLTAGIRWSRDEREAAVLNRSVPLTGGPGTTLIDGRGEGSYSNVSPTAIVRFDLSDDANAYGKISRGYKGGGYALSASSSASFARGFGPESLTTYEVGLKSEWLGRRLRFNTALFYNDYKDIQTNVWDPNNPRLLDVINAGKATTQGLEVDVTAQLLDSFSVSGSYGYVDAKYDEVRDLGGNDITSRFQFVLAPETSFSLSADYRSPQTRLGIVEANLGYTWQDKQFGVATDPRYVVGSRGLLSTRLGLAGVGGIEGLRLAAWGRNLTDEDYQERSFGIGTAFVGIFGQPRSYGVDLSMEF